MANGNEEPGNENPVTTVWETTDKTLTKKEKHEKPVERTTTWNIADEQAKVDKIDGVIARWQAERKVHQDVIDKHTEEFGKI